MPRKKEPSSTTENNAIARQLTALMSERDLTQATLGKALDIQRQTVSNYANGQSVPDAYTLGKIADYFGVSTDYLLDRTKTKSPDATVTQMCEYTWLSEESVETLNFWKRNGDGPVISTLDLLVRKYPETWESISICIEQAFNCGFLSKQHTIDDEDDFSDIAPFIFRMRDEGVFKEHNEIEGIQLPAGYLPLKADDAKNYYIQKASRLFLDYLENVVEMLSDARSVKEEE